MTAAGAPRASNSVCPRCGNSFRCGMVGGDASCWCVKLPHVMPLPASPSSSPSSPADASKASCFCPACLQQITDERQHAPSPARD